MFEAVGSIRFEAIGAIFNTLGFSFSVSLILYSYLFRAYSFVSILLAKWLFIVYASIEPHLSLVSHSGPQRLVTSEVDRSLSQDKF